jgi:hypothetical protein
MKAGVPTETIYYIASNDEMINEWLIGSDLEGNCPGIICIKFHGLAGGTEEKYKTLCQDSRCPDGDLNRLLLEHLTRDLPVANLHG